MYDTVNFRLTGAEVGGNIDFRETVPYLLDKGSVVLSCRDNGLEYYTGRLGNYRVNVNRWTLTVKDGSLCKWFNGDNFQTLGRSDTHRAIERLSDELHLPMFYATVTRFDIGVNLLLSQPPEVYFPYLGFMKYYKRQLFPTGLYYSSSNKTLCFYDKIAEAAVHGGVQELYKGRNVLRCELRYMKRLRKDFGCPVVADMLYKESFYIEVIKRLKSTYNMIDKNEDVCLDFSNVRGKKELYCLGVMTLAERFGGDTRLLSMIDEARAKKTITAKQCHDLRKAVRSSFHAGNLLTTPSPLVGELSNTFAEALRFYR